MMTAITTLLKNERGDAHEEIKKQKDCANLLISHLGLIRILLASIIKNGILLKRGIPLLLFWTIIAVHHLEIVVTSGFDFLMCFKVVRD